MWFKNIQIFLNTAQLSIDTEQLQEQLNEHRFQPCKSIETYRLGWVFPAATS
ncbi:MAG: recombination-associated protein RdgC, partial [Oceanospirillaceae bacterium]|nr:recombination-associated protein RdgC [Oceanospirillaceae bacterium]